MKKRAFITFAMTAVLLTVSLFGGVGAAEAAKEPAVRTILIWADGASLENPQSGTVSKRLMDMMDMEIPDSVNMIVLTGGVESGWYPELPLEGTDAVRTDCNQVWKLKGAHDGQRGALVLLEENGLPGAEKSPLTHPDTLKTFIDYGAANYPAEMYDLILVSHGGGPAVGWGMDEVFMREDGAEIMSLPEICRALKNSAVERFDFINFFACLMGSAEVAAALSPYTDTLIFSEENLPGHGVMYQGMLEMLRKDPRTDSFLLGKRLVDDTIESFQSDDLELNMSATYSVIDTKKMVQRLMPELAALSDLLYREAAEPGQSGEYAFYDELRSIRRSVEFGQNGIPSYELFDLGNFVSALGVADTELENAADIGELRNAYTDVAVRILGILSDRDGSGDDVLYSRDTNSIHKAAGSFYTRDAEGRLFRDDSGYLKATGLSIFFDTAQTWQTPYYSEAIDGVLALGDLDEQSAHFLKTYRDASLLYTLILGSGKAVFARAGQNGLTAADLLAAWEELGLASWGRIPLGFRDTGIKETYEIVKASGFDADAWLEKIAAQQASEIMKKDSVAAVRRRESGTERGTAGSYRLVSGNLPARQLDNLYLRVKLKTDYPYNSTSSFDASDQFMPYGERYLTGSISDDLVMPALFYGENGGDFLRLVYGSQAAWEIGLYDGKWYTLEDAAGNRAIVQIYPDTNDPEHVQVPAELHFGEPDQYSYNNGMLNFFIGGKEEAPAAGFAANHEHLALTEGNRRLDGEAFANAYLKTIAALRRGARIVIGPDMKLDGSETGGLKLVRVPAAEIKEVKDVLGEYYLRDIYGNELILTDAFAAADQEPLLKNLAFAEAKAENGTVTVTCGGETLDPDLDYMVYTKDGETLIQGVGEYAGSIVLDDVK